MAESIPRRTRRHPSNVLIGAIATTLLVAACSAGGPSTPSDPGAATTAPAAPATTATSPAMATASPGAPEASPIESATTVGPTPFQAPGDLATLIPTEVAGHAMTIERGGSSNFLILWNDPKVARELLSRLGKSEGDVTIAYGYADVATPQALHVDAYRVAGADGKALMAGMVERYLAMLDGWKATSTTLGGKAVTILGPAGAAATAGQVYYAVGDIVFNVSASPGEWVTAALVLLP